MKNTQVLFLRPLVVICILAVTNLAQANLAARFDAEKAFLQAHPNASLTINPQMRKNMGQHDFVLIDGILGDLAKSLYKSVIPFLNVQFPESLVTVLRPSSFWGLEANADAIARSLKFTGRPRIVIAHSRGAAELFLALLKNPDLLENENIAKVILVQGAFSGSPVAEFSADMLARGCEGRDKGPIGSACDFAGLFSESVKTLIPTEARAQRLPRQKLISESAKRLFQEKVYFVRSRSSVKATQMALKASALYLKTYYSAFENDGILLTMQQRIHGFGADLGVLEADHFSLLGHNKKSPTDSQAFMKALLDELFSNKN